MIELLIGTVIGLALFVLVAFAIAPVRAERRAVREMRQRFGQWLDRAVRRVEAPLPTTPHERAWDLMMLGRPEEMIARQSRRRAEIEECRREHGIPVDWGHG